MKKAQENIQHVPPSRAMTFASRAGKPRGGVDQPLQLWRPRPHILKLCASCRKVPSLCQHGILGLTLGGDGGESRFGITVGSCATDRSSPVHTNTSVVGTAVCQAAVQGVRGGGIQIRTTVIEAAADVVCLAERIHILRSIVLRTEHVVVTCASGRSVDGDTAVKSGVGAVIVACKGRVGIAVGACGACTVKKRDTSASFKNVAKFEALCIRICMRYMEIAANNIDTALDIVCNSEDIGEASVVILRAGHGANC